MRRRLPATIRQRQQQFATLVSPVHDLRRHIDGRPCAHGQTETCRRRDDVHRQDNQDARTKQESAPLLSLTQGRAEIFSASMSVTETANEHLCSGRVQRPARIWLAGMTM